MSGLSGKIILITGASAGIGAAAAEDMAGLGCKLALVARNLERLKEVAQKCTKLGAADVFVASHDLSVPEECRNAVEEVVERFGGKYVR